MDDVAKLIKTTVTGRDKYGNAIKTEERTQVFIQTRGVYSSEFYSASQLGLKPTITFMISNPADYHDESTVEYHGDLYSVIRVDWNGDTVRLICEKKVKS